MREEYAFTVRDVITQIRAVASAEPLHVYLPPTSGGTCSYVTGWDGQGCIVGQALMRLGVSPAWLSEREKDAPGGVPAHEVLDDLIGEDESMERQQRWIAVVQAQQDEQVPWGMAVYEADRDVKV